MKQTHLFWVNKFFQVFNLVITSTPFGFSNAFVGYDKRFVRALIMILVTIVGAVSIGNCVAQDTNSSRRPGYPFDDKNLKPWVPPVRFASRQENEDDDSPTEQNADDSDTDLDDLADDELDALDDLEADDKPEPFVFGTWPRKDIREINIDVRDFNQVIPKDQSQQLIASSRNNWVSFSPSPMVFAWSPPNIRYQPLYFEDVALERYGQERRGVRQFVVSSAHFFKSGLFLPYSMAIDHPHSCEYPLGFCRPGNDTPKTIQRHWYGWQSSR